MVTVTALNRLCDLQLVHTYASLPGDFYAEVHPTPLPGARLAAFDAGAAEQLGWSAELASDPTFLQWLAGHPVVPGAQPLATVYAGHQFGVWVPQLGDGRAILLGEAHAPDGTLWDLQLKGGGPTPFSRQGDGRAVTRSVVREYLAGIAMRGLGIPTTSAVAMVVSEEPVRRESVERAAALLRVAESHVRFGHFEYFYFHHGKEALQSLLDYVVGRNYPALRGRKDAASALFHEVCARTASLIARWMAAGFQHGVMNTDNMSVIGDTIDYGPYGFMDRFDPAWICNHSDHTGRYAFMQQPGIGLWNLGRLARALTPLAPEADLVAGLELYQREVAKLHQALMCERLGLRREAPGDDELLMDLLALMHRNGADYHNTLRALADFEPGRPCESVRRRFADLPAIDGWLQRYGARVQAEQEPPAERRARMDATNPKYVLRNHIAQEVIVAVEGGDFTLLRELAQVLQAPFDSWAGHEAWAEDAPDWARQLEISCSS